MPKLIVDKDACTLCGLCAADCPGGIISVSGNSLPAYIPDGEKRCIICGHCQAVCPTDAIKVEDPRLDGRTLGIQKSLLGMELAEEYFRSRRSVRQYKREPVEKEVVLRLMETVRYAPSAMNAHPLHWLIILDPAEVRRLTDLVVDWMEASAKTPSPLNDYFNFSELAGKYRNGRDPVLRGAPHLVVVHARKDIPSAHNDAFISLSHLDLLAPSFGLGTCWAGVFQIAAMNWKPLEEALNLPEGHKPIYAMMLGKPAVKYARAPKRPAGRITWR